MKYKVSVPFDGYIRYIVDVPDDAPDPRTTAIDLASALHESDDLVFESTTGTINYNLQGENGDEPISVDPYDENEDE